MVNTTDEAAVVRIVAHDSSGTTYETVTLSLGPRQTAHFNSDDLESGNTSKGLSAGVGPGQGDWWLELSGDRAVEVLAYIRTSDGFLTAMHDRIPARAMRYRAPTFNPAGNRNQVSLLRLVNPGTEEAQVRIAGVDDRGLSPGSDLHVRIPAGGSRTLSAQDLEAGRAEFPGALEDGAGKWQLLVESDREVVAMSLLSSPTGHLTNLSSAPVRGVAETAMEAYGTRIGASVVDANCAACHVVGGEAASTRLVFASTDDPERAVLNRRAFKGFLEAVEGGRQLVLGKVSGAVAHEGGEPIAAGTEKYRELARFLTALDNEPAPSFAVGPLRGSDIAVTALREHPLVCIGRPPRAMVASWCPGA